MSLRFTKSLAFAVKSSTGGLTGRDVVDCGAGRVEDAAWSELVPALHAAAMAISTGTTTLSTRARQLSFTAIPFAC